MWRAWTDGAARKGADDEWHAGVGVVMFRERDPDSRRESAFHICGCTSQRAELEAVIEAIEMVAPGERLHVETDSQYVVSGMYGAWNLSAKNKSVWDKLRRLSSKRDVEYTHIPRCSGPEAVAVDRLAKHAMRMKCDSDT